MGIEWINVILLGVLCVACIYTDRKYGYIFNRYLLALGIPAAAVHVLTAVLHSPENLWFCLEMTILAISVSLFLYTMKIWAGGDCKLYAVIALSTPWPIVEKTFWNISYLLLIPVFAFAFGYIFLIVESVRRYIQERQYTKDVLRQTLGGLFRYIQYFIAISFFNYVIVYVTNTCMGIQVSSWVHILVNISLVLILDHFEILKYKSVVLTFAAADVVLGIVNFHSLLDTRSVVTWLMVCFTYLMRTLTSRYNYEEIPFEKLQEGMILSMPCSLMLANEKKCAFNSVSDESLGSRLKLSDVEVIKTYCKERKAYSSLIIVRKVPFALYLSAAALLIILGGTYFEFADF